VGRKLSVNLRGVRIQNPKSKIPNWPAVVILALIFCGCASTRPPAPASSRAFNFQTDTFAYANELVWEYHLDPQTGKMTGSRRAPKPDYTHHCFVVARAARQFFQHAHFAASLTKADAATYQKLVHQVMARSPRRDSSAAERVVIPGYANLREFSRAHAALLKAACGGAWQSYFQRGHWRMIMPFSRRQQEEVARRLLAEVRANHPPVTHIVRFPELTINHAVVLFSATESEREIIFAVYDPNEPSAPTTLTFDRPSRTFQFPANDYFTGGRVDAYEVYSSVLY